MRGRGERSGREHVSFSQCECVCVDVTGANVTGALLLARAEVQ